MRPRPPVDGMYPPYMYPMMHPGMGPMPGMPQQMLPPGAAPMVPGGPMPPYMQPYAAPAPQAPVRPAQQLPTDKEQLGEYLYPLVEAKDAKNAAKITGMLLEMEVDQIHNIISDQGQLDKWITEALKVLNTTAASA
ncbi:MAG: hypothetical protein P4L10_13065 [Acidobacteriaceae bacterium]|nr:hypothetical protein [Acidobacteriaceae bacterium]